MGISPWHRHFVEFTCIEIGNAFPSFIEFLKKSSLNLKIVFFFLYKKEIRIYNTIQQN